MKTKTYLALKGKILNQKEKLYLSTKYSFITFDQK